MILLFSFNSPPLIAQSTATTDGETSTSSTGDYEAYKPEEFPQWARSLRRYETIFFGSLPFAFLFTGLGFDLYKYGDSNFDEAYLPLFLGNSPEKEAFTRDTIPQRIVVSVSLSAIVAMVDFFLDRRDREGRDLGGQSDGQTDVRADRQADVQTDVRADRQADLQNDGQADVHADG